MAVQNSTKKQSVTRTIRNNLRTNKMTLAENSRNTEKRKHNRDPTANYSHVRAYLCAQL